ncbi:DUF1264 domain-containing protein [Candidatus Nitrosocosmicus sp. FF01]|uniref:DUF1264 domain-containing protein n=1 Tax=Candidatus Nitrosocosmicus sp. FF01 TaxID=3397670 RepID=UPI0039E93CF8
MNHTRLWYLTSQRNKIMSFTLAMVLFMGIYTIAFSIGQYSTVQAQGNNTAPPPPPPSPMNATQINTTSANVSKPVDGYGGPPTGPLTAVRHVFDDPTLRVYHFCKPNDKIMMVCQLYDSTSPNATLIGVEYMIDSKTYQAIPDREKPNWHYHKEEFSPDRANPKFPLLNEQQQKEWLAKLSESYGKVILNWNPVDTLPVFPPQIQQVQHPFMVNQSVTNQTEKHTGSFNQTLSY